MKRCFYFGCWGRAGHFLHAPSGRPVYRSDDLVYYGSPRQHLDGSLAPRKHEHDGRLCWSGQVTDEAITYRSEEYPQGRFLLHHLDTGFTAIQWWDRTQGDSRGACNSTILLEGEHTAGEMIAALHEHFPTVAANLKAAGIELVEVRRESS